MFKNKVTDSFGVGINALDPLHEIATITLQEYGILCPHIVFIIFREVLLQASIVLRLGIKHHALLKVSIR